MRHPLVKGGAMSRETAGEKVARLLTSGAVAVLEARPGHITAVVSRPTAAEIPAGAGYVVTYRRGGRHCPCAHPGRCTHLTAVMSVTDPGRRP